MKIARCSFENRDYLAVVDEQRQEVLLTGEPLDAHANPVLELIQGGGLASGGLDHGQRLAFSDVRFLSPLSVLVRNLFAIGKNYHDHALEFDRSGFNATQGAATSVPAYPQVFTKATTTLCGPGDAIRFDPAYTQSVDYEGEIGVVMGFMPPKFLRHGDIVRIAAPGLGELVNPVQAGPA